MAKRKCKKKLDPEIAVKFVHVDAPDASKRLHEVFTKILEAASRKKKEIPDDEEKV